MIVPGAAGCDTGANGHEIRTTRVSPAIVPHQYSLGVIQRKKAYCIALTEACTREGCSLSGGSGEYLKNQKTVMISDSRACRERPKVRSGAHPRRHVRGGLRLPASPCGR